VNNIQAKDWAEDDWGCHSGMASNPYDEEEQSREDNRAPTEDQAEME